MYEPIERTSTVDAVAQRLRGDILRGRYAPGTRLPPERELALALGVNRLTLRAALSRLIAEGLVASFQGDGNRVLDFRTHAGLECLPDLADAMVADGRQEDLLRLMSDLRAAWRAILLDALVLAARHATPEDLERLKGLVAEQEGRRGDPDAFLEGDLALTRVLLRIGGNVAHELIFNTVLRFAREQADLFRRFYAEPQVTLRAYDALLGLLDQGDVEAVRDVARQGLESHDELVLARIAADLRNGRTKTAAAKGRAGKKPTRVAGR